MRTAMVFGIGLMLLWSSHASGSTATVDGGQTDNADHVLVPCDPSDSSVAPFQVAEADAPILLAQATQCAQDKKSGGMCSFEGTLCGSKSNQGVCTTIAGNQKGQFRCVCARKKV